MTLVNVSSAAASQPRQKPHKLEQHRHQRVDWRGWVFMGPFVVVFVFVFVVPVVYAVYLSFFQQRMVGGDGFCGVG